MSTPNRCRVDQFKTNEETEGNKTERSTYLIRTVNCSSVKNLLTIKVMKLILLLIRKNNSNNDKNNYKIQKQIYNHGHNILRPFYV